MIYQFKDISIDNIKDFELIFKLVFGNKQENKRVNLLKKIAVEYTGVSYVGAIAYDTEGNPAGALGLFPVVMSINGERIIGAQIGDAMVLEQHRNQNLFTQLIEVIKIQASKNGIDCLFTFPNVNNVGSYKGFIKTHFVELGTLFTFQKSILPSYLSRIFRKISFKLYTRYEDTLLNNVSTNASSLYTEAQKHSVIRNELYFNYKTFKKNKVIKLKSGIVWVSVGVFMLGIGDYKLNKGASFEDLLLELSKFSRKLGKDTLLFCSNSDTEIDLFSSDSSYKKSNSSKVMIYTTNANATIKSVSFNYADVDTF